MPKKEEIDLVIVDDNKSTRKIICYMVSKMNFENFKINHYNFPDIYSAWAHIKKCGADILLSDLNIPTDNNIDKSEFILNKYSEEGLQLLEKIRLSKEFSEMVIIMSSGNFNIPSINKLQEMTDYTLPKPIDFQDLFRIFKQILSEITLLKQK